MALNKGYTVSYHLTTVSDPKEILDHAVSVSTALLQREAATGRPGSSEEKDCVHPLHTARGGNREALFNHLPALRHQRHILPTDYNNPKDVENMDNNKKLQCL